MTASKIFSDGLKLHIGRAFVDLPDLSVSVELLHRIFLCEPDPAQELHAHGGGALSHLAGEQFRHGRLFDEGHPGVF